MGFFETLEKIPMGKEALKSLKKMGFEVKFERGLKDAGCCDASKKIILLNPMAAERDLLPTFMHEARHAMQSEILTVDDEKTQVADTIKAYRMMEADACAYETAFVVQAQKSGVAVRSTKMADLYRKTEGKGTDKAMAAVCRLWYADAENMTLYDEFYADQFEEMAKKAAKRNDPDCFNQKIPADRIAGVCPYLDNEFLNSPEAFSIRSSAKERISDAMDNYAAKTGTKADQSVKTMYSRAKNGKITDDREMPSVAILAKRNAYGR